MSQYPTVAFAHSNVNVEATTTVIAAADTGRRLLILQNTSDTIIDIKIGADAVLGEGIRLYPNGGTFEIKPIAGTLDTRVVNGISASGTKTIRVTKG